MAGLAPLRDATRARPRPDPHRKPGRPREIIELPAPPPTETATRPPPVAWRAINYDDLFDAMANIDTVVKTANRNIAAAMARKTAPTTTEAQDEHAIEEIGRPELAAPENKT